MYTKLPIRFVRKECRGPVTIICLGSCVLVFFLVVYTLLQWPIPPTPETIFPLFMNSLQRNPPFNASKVALLIESRPSLVLTSLMIHFIALLPPDWKFRFMGSPESVKHLNHSSAIRAQVKIGKLELTLIPGNVSTINQEGISQFLTSLWLYEQILSPAEWLLIFQIDSMLCANSRHDLNNWLAYDWVGAPWHPDARFGGNGGLSLRRVSKIIQILKKEQRVPFSEPEDVWLTNRLYHLPDSKLANGSIGLSFSGEMYAGKKEKISGSSDSSKAGNLVKGIDDWRVGFYEPMGYHTGSSGNKFHSAVWGTDELRQHIWSYCPEIKMILDMDLAQFLPVNCNKDKLL
ncbi:hypothetical protein K3495_g9715 [Podosphaera aphanis]|nr:hypothetical protein K3495_g9715 [Podosphaera aphanis]